MPSPYLTRRLRNYEEVNQQFMEDRQHKGPRQDAQPVRGSAGPQELATGERQAA